MANVEPQPQSAEPMAPFLPKKRTLRESAEDNVAIFLITAIVTGFVAGFGAYATILKVSHQKTISEDRLNDLEKNEHTPKGLGSEGLNLVAVNPKRPDSVYLGTIPPGKTVYVVTQGTFDVWGQPDRPGVYQDPSHGGGLWISAVAVTGETVYDGWYAPPLHLSGSAGGNDVKVLVSVRPRDIKFDDNCCDDFKMALVQAN